MVTVYEISQIKVKPTNEININRYFVKT
jgi:hypothetical protein